MSYMYGLSGSFPFQNVYNNIHCIIGSEVTVPMSMYFWNNSYDNNNIAYHCTWWLYGKDCQILSLNNVRGQTLQTRDVNDDTDKCIKRNSGSFKGK